jgi:hypothetical protein
MNVAVIVGRGPEADLLLERRSRLPKKLLLLEPDFSRSKRGGLPVIALTRPEEANRLLSAHGATRIAMVGDLRFDNTKQGPRYRRWATRLIAPGNNSDILKRCVHEEFGQAFKFPAVRTVFPFLFLKEDLLVNPDSHLLARALRQTSPSAGCASLNVGGEATKILRMAEDSRTNFLHFRLTPSELRNLHQTRSVKRVFFNRKQTIVIGGEEMAAYAREHSLTLQSFA